MNNYTLFKLRITSGIFAAIGSIVFSISLTSGANLSDILHKSIIGIGGGIMATGVIGFIATGLIEAQLSKQGKKDSKLIQEESNIIYEQNRNQSETSIAKISYKFIRIDNLPNNNTTCAISKTLCNKNDKLVQCPQCLSYFKAEYLIDWLSSNNYCPVCDSNLKEIIWR